MSFLAAADMQCEWANLDLCTESWNEILHICLKYHLKTIVFCGDGKEAYDPVSIRVVKWWQKAIRKAKKLGISVLYLMGNHDRIATYSEAGNWLSILRHAGAITFDTPGVWVHEGIRFFMLPFAKLDQTKAWAKELVKQQPNKDKDILFFHANLLEARYSQHEHTSDSKLSVNDLYHNRYLFCVGGDIHLPQKIENVYYVGSSFCHDWGEVNQRKRYLVVRGSNITSVHSRIPRWFDPSISGFHRSKPSNYKGARVRLQVSCSASENYERKLERIRKEAERKYKGAELYIVPKFKDRDIVETTIQFKDSDERKIKEYMQQSGSSVAGVLGYMLEKLSHFSHGLRTSSRFKFKWAKATNYLSFEKLKFDFTQKGIIVINGVNQDRGSKSNGAGKTSFINVLPVAWFGKTFKGQAHDRWSNRFHKKEQATVEICGRDVKHREICVLRGRRPTALKLLVDGKNESTGMKSTDRTGTQAQIEQVTGFSWDTLANAVYIDRTICDAFLSGTKSQRTEVLSRFQNLERFEKALKLVKKDLKDNSDKREQNAQDLSNIRGRIQECTKSLRKLEALRSVQIRSAKKEYKRASSAYHKFEIPKLKSKELENRYDNAREVLRTFEQAVTALVGERNQAKLWVKKWHKLEQKEYCPTCYQDLSSKQFAIHFKKDKQKLKKVEANLKIFLRKLKQATHKFDNVAEEFDHMQSKLDRLENKKSNLRTVMQVTRDHYQQLRHGTHGIGKATKELGDLQRKKFEIKRYKKHLYKYRMMYEYAAQAFSRDGIPAFLNRQLCPVLNKASDYYAELFSDKEIQVRFKVEGGEFVPQIINAKGGEHIKDQSEGERALAGLISSFALREAAPETNLLILDEPGSGLDEQTAKQFARSLKVLNKRFRLIIIATHNQVISSALAGEQVITIRKHNGISSVREE